MTFTPPAARRLSGSEPFDGVEALVVDFWKFAMSDLRTNNIRGYLAEFLVARAVGSATARVEWDPWDVTAPDGTRIEVKSSGYLQVWTQEKLSKPSYRVAPAYGWDSTTGAWSAEQGFHADAYVFCLHTAKTHEEYDPLAVSQWRFYVAGRTAVEERAGAAMGLAKLVSVAGEPVPYHVLGETIAAVGEGSRLGRSS